MQKRRFNSPVRLMLGRSFPPAPAPSDGKSVFPDRPVMIADTFH